jgi:twitching motility protein PilT
MQLLDDHMFKLWREGVVNQEECLVRCVSPDELRKRFQRAEQGLFEDEDAARERKDKKDKDDE